MKNRVYATNECPESISAAKVSSLTKKPPRGGRPLIEKRRIAKIAASIGSESRIDDRATR